MLSRRTPYIAGFVKVEVRSRSPKLWGWTIFRNGNDTPVQTSTMLFRHAEDAWKAGDLALQELRPLCTAETARPVAQEHLLELAE